MSMLERALCAFSYMTLALVGDLVFSLPCHSVHWSVTQPVQRDSEYI